MTVVHALHELSFLLLEIKGIPNYPSLFLNYLRGKVSGCWWTTGHHHSHQQEVKLAFTHLTDRGEEGLTRRVKAIPTGLKLAPEPVSHGVPRSRPPAFRPVMVAPGVPFLSAHTVNINKPWAHASLSFPPRFQWLELLKWTLSKLGGNWPFR